MDIIELKNRTDEAEYRHPWELARVQIAIRKLRKLTRGKDLSTVTIVDIGCGDLFVLETIGRALPFRALVGIDPALDDDTLGALNQRYAGTNIRAHKQLDDFSPEKGGTFIVLLLDVVEHIKDDTAFMADLSRRAFVGADTSVLITVPSYNALFCSHDDILLHYRRYTNRQMAHLVENTGFQVVERGYFFASLIPPRLLAVAKERFTGAGARATGLSTWNGGWFSTNLIKSVLLLDYYVLSFFSALGIRLPGLSNFVLCKKK